MSALPTHIRRVPVPVLTVQQVAAELGVSKMTVYRLTASGELPSVRIGRSIRVRVPDLDAYLSRAVSA